jgi:hypothetical protein
MICTSIPVLITNRIYHLWLNLFIIL